MTGVTFRKSNLTNCNVPAGNTVDGNSCSTDRLCVQNDYEDWLVDDQGDPLAPVNPKAFDRWGVSKDPVDIPATPRPDGKAATIAAEETKLAEAQAAADQAYENSLKS